MTNEERLQEIEDLLLLMQLENTKIKEKFGIDITEKPIPSAAKLPADIEERLSRIESSLSGKEVPKDVSAMLEAMKSRVQEIDGIKAKITNAEKAFKTEIERLEALKIPSEKGIEQYLDRISRTKSDIDREVERLKSIKGELDEAAKDKQSLIQRITESEINMEKTDTLFTKIRTLEEKIHADIEKIESLKDSIDSKLRFGLEKIEMTRKDLESRISTSEEKIKARVEKMDSIKDSLDTKLTLAGEKISELERFAGDIENIKKSLSSSAFIEVTSLKKKVDELSLLKESVDEEAATRVSLEKRLQDIGRRLRTMEELRSSVDEESIDIVSIDKKLQDLANEISLLKTRPYGIGTEIEKELSREKEALMARISEVRAGIEKEAKLVSESDIRKLHSEVAEQRKIIGGMERRLENAAVKFFTENLEEFAKAVDRKLPELVRKEDYEKDVREIAKKMQVIESPDMTPLSSRVYMLEKKIDEIYTLMRSLSTRMPVVVE